MAKTVLATWDSSVPTSSVIPWEAVSRCKPPSGTRMWFAGWWSSRPPILVGQLPTPMALGHPLVVAN